MKFIHLLPVSVAITITLLLMVAHSAVIFRLNVSMRQLAYYLDFLLLGACKSATLRFNDAASYKHEGNYAIVGASDSAAVDLGANHKHSCRAVRLKVWPPHAGPSCPAIKKELDV